MTELPQGWVMTTLDEIARVVRNGVFVSRPEETPPGSPILRISAVRPMHLDTAAVRFARPVPSRADEYKLRGGDLLFTRYNGTRDFVGACAVVPDCAAGLLHPDKLIRVVLNAEAAAPGFVAAYASSPGGRRWLESVMRTTAGQTGLAGGDLRRFPVPLAPLVEQERIVTAVEEAFSKLDAGEAGLRTVRQLLKRMRESLLMTAVTGRLIPLSGDVAADDPALELLRQASTDRPRSGRRISRAADVPVPSVDLPPSWRWVRWSQVGHCQNGRGFPSDHYRVDGVPLLRPGNLAVDGRVRWTETNTRYLPQDYEHSSADLVVGPYEVVINLTAQSLKDDFLGRACITGPAERCLLNQRLARLTPFATSSAYALLFFRSPLFRDFVKTLNTGSLIQHMYTHQVDSCWIPLPPPADQDSVVAEAGRCLSVIDQLERIVEAAADRGVALRRSVLTAAFEGRLVSQDPSDEPASELLERTQAERASSGIRRRKKVERL